jgi:hypothetical protein
MLKHPEGDLEIVPQPSLTGERRADSGSAGWWQSAGIVTPIWRAASRTEVAAGTMTGRPSITTEY